MTETPEIKRWVDEILTAVLQDRILSREVEEAAGGLALVSADADRIKDFVFESIKLPEIRGASQIVRDLTQGDGPAALRQAFRSRGLPDERCVVYAGGGSILAIVPAGLAEGICREMERTYVRTTGAASLTATYLRVTSELLAKCFGEQVRAAGVMLRRAKESRRISPFFEVSPLARRCASCGSRPASDCDPRKDTEVRYLCSVCIQKVKQSGEEKEGKLEYFQRFEKQLLPSDFYTSALPNGVSHVQPARDLTDISKADPEKMVALIYADGDAVGKHLSSLKTLKEYSHKSDALHCAMDAIVFRSLADNLRPASGIHAFEVLTIGGDDVLLFVPGSAALQVTLDICEGFSTELENKEWKPAPSMSAGVVIAHADNPVRFMRDIAEQLLKSAKKRAHSERRGAVDFAVLKSQSMVASNIEVLRAKAYSYQLGNRERISITGRPFSLIELERLLNQARLLKHAGFPGSQSQAFRDLFRDAGRVGKLWPWLRYQREKYRMKEIHQKVLQKIESDWLSARSNRQDMWPWLDSHRDAGWVEFQSVWEDLHEVRNLLAVDEPSQVEREVEMAMRLLKIDARPEEKENEN